MRVFESQATAAAAVVDEIVAVLMACRAQHRRPVLALPTGGTPVAIYGELLRRQSEGLELQDLVSFNLDEFLDLPDGHPGSYRAWMRGHFHGPAGIAPAAAHFPDAATAPADYEAAIARAGGLDMAVLGIGGNGHVAFNEPGSAPDSRTREVRIEESSRRANAGLFASLEEVPARARTMGIATLLDARALRMVAFGAAKAEIVRRALEEPPTPEVPASLLRGHRDFRCFLDAAAASRLGGAKAG
ncbi:MAG TPA: glucosamine-6-phosphate deaminase [Planctomycetota bacterium]